MPETVRNSISRKVLEGLKPIFMELWYRVFTDDVPWIRCSALLCGISLSQTLRWDRYLLQQTPLWILYPGGRSASHWVYAFGLDFSPFILWALNQIRIRSNLLHDIEQTFMDCGLRTVTGEMPSLISSIPIDSNTRRLRFRNVGFPKRDFQGSPDLETGLKGYILDISENRSRNTIDIILSSLEPSLKHEPEEPQTYVQVLKPIVPVPAPKAPKPVPTLLTNNEEI